VVQGHEQQVVRLAHLYQHGPDKRPAPQVEGQPGLKARKAQSFFPPLSVIELSQIDPRKVQSRMRGDELQGLPFDDGERRAQSLVPPDYLVDAPLKHVNIERAFQANRRRHVIKRAAWLKLVQKP
jgi:hypothetical protein